MNNKIKFTKIKKSNVSNSIISNKIKMIEVKNLSFSYNEKFNKNKHKINNNHSNSNLNSDNYIFKNISFEIYRGDFVAIIGPNGVGKSTLIKVLTGFIKIKPDNKGKTNLIKINGRISYIPQKFNQDYNFPAKVSELLDLECCKCNLRNNILKSLDIYSIENKQFKDLSGGQQQRVLIAMSLLSNPDILILDEPTVGIDAKSQEGFYNILRDLNKNENLTILLITHDTSMISNYFNKTLCIFNKNICIDDAKNSHNNLHKIYGCNFHEIKHNHIGGN